MTEPIYNTPEIIPDRMKSINTILEDYKTNIISENTLNNQSPQETDARIRDELSRKGNLLIQFFKYSEKDPAIEEIINDLEPLLTPWAPELRPNCEHATTLLFLDYPMILSVEHAIRQNKNKAIV